MSKNNAKGKYHYFLNLALKANNKNEIVDKIKNGCDFPDLVQLVEPLKASSQKLNHEIDGIPFPKASDEIFNRRNFYRPAEITNELNWLVLSIKSHKNEISDFVVKKEEFENNFLLGKYANCQKILDYVFENYGYSFWYIEQRFLLFEYLNKPEAQKLFLSELNKTNTHIGGLFSQFLSQRTERNLSAYKFDYDVKNLFKRDREDFYQNASRSFYKYALNYFEYTNPESLIYIVLFNNYLSVFDRYLATLNILKSLYLEKQAIDFALEKAVYIYRKVKDKNLLNIIISFVPDFRYEEDFIDDHYIEILDEYYIGNYKKVLEKSSQYAKDEKISLEVLKLYAKSLIALDWSFSAIYPENSIAHNLSSSIYNVLSRPDDSLILDKLYTTQKNLMSFSFAGELNYFLKSEQNKNVSKELHYIFCSRLTPFLYKILMTPGLVFEYFSVISEKFPKSMAVQYLKAVSDNSLDLNPAISDEIRRLDKCSILFELSRYEDCITEALDVLILYSKNPPIIQKLTKLIFESQVQLGKYNEAIQIYVEQYLENPISVNKINPEDLLEKMRSVKYKGIKRTNGLVIFTTLTSNDDAEKAFILETVISIFGITMPSELFDFFPDNREKELFLFKCCTSEILKHYIYLNKTLARLEERQKILNYLLQNFSDPKKLYSKQLDHITNEIIIYEGTRKLDESKIYANDQAIIDNELQEIEGLFSRFKTIYNIISKDQNVILLSANSYQFIKISPKSDRKDNDTKYTTSALLEVFSEIFDLILQKYLFSKFGIVAYLSTRIRHGVLGGEIRPEIDKHNLILNRKSNSLEYHDSLYWAKPYYGLNISELKKLNEILSKFSLNVDNIIEEILKHKIQIKVDNHNTEGLFNYQFSKQELNAMAYSLAKEENAKIFSQKIIDNIWERTDFNLEVIRNYFNEDVSIKFHYAFTQLEDDLRSHFGEKIKDIYTKIVGCNTIIANRLKKIGEWFKRTGSTLDNFDINNLFQIIWQNTEKCYPNGKAQLEVSAKSQFPLIQSKYYIHFTDLFRIFIDNMFKYSSIENGEKSFKIELDRSGEIFVAVFQNNTSYENCDFFTNDSEVNLDDSKLTIEKNSGISKSVKIIKYDLNDISNNLNISYRALDESSDLYLLKLTLSINLKTLIVNEKDFNC